ncbi:hypothetical protein HS088_TW11G00953 [Tripterygium wilfordii]|uniref:Uncharacterized protein n=1 Tax=Tripterygium wilfordii TaxID=458696 RepID=A0A7J7D3H6_TRIWF|nr:uncharacterized protein LOC120009340 [Tripterygium wilfordii]KAF5740873.1 hypothetical protein HS088_TW11G00953 [Tripterygium wilfordii]
MALLVRPLWQLPQLYQHYYSCATLMRCFPYTRPQLQPRKQSLISQRALHLPKHPSTFAPAQIARCFTAIQSRRTDASDSVGEERNSRNQRTREAKRAVQWGIDLASFSTLQIKRIFRASLEQEVLDAIMLVKALQLDQLCCL